VALDERYPQHITRPWHAAQREVHITVKGNLEPDLVSTLSSSQYIPKILSTLKLAGLLYRWEITYRTQRCLRILTTYDQIQSVVEGASWRREPAAVIVRPIIPLIGVSILQ